MNWQPPTGWCQESEDRAYSVAKVGLTDGYRYEAWRTRRHRDGPHCLAVNLTSAEIARQHCEEDHASESA